MDSEIIAAIIGGIAVIIAAIIGLKKSDNSSGERNSSSGLKKNIWIVLFIVVAIIAGLVWIKPYFFGVEKEVVKKENTIPEGTWYSENIDPICGVEIANGDFSIFSVESNDGIKGKMEDIVLIEEGVRFSINYVFSDTETETGVYYYEIKYLDKNYDTIKVRDDRNGDFVTYVKKQNN